MNMVSSHTLILLFAAVFACSNVGAFQSVSSPLNSLQRSLAAKVSAEDDCVDNRSSRRAVLKSAAILTTAALLPISANADEQREDSMYSPKFVQTYEDFTSTSEGWSYKDVKVGTGTGGGDLRDGDRVVFDWSGYTIGYFGRPFEAKGGPQGGAFDKDINYFRATLGSNQIIKGLECALRTMKPGGIRQVIIPYGSLSYPPEDKDHELVGPKPTTFSGMRALNFVLENPRVDRTLLFNLKLIRVDRSDRKGGFIRG